MKKYFLTCAVLFVTGFVVAQPPKTKTKPSQSQMDKAMDDAMKDMSEDEKAEMRKMMKDVMPALTDQNSKMADYPEFTSNKQLVPKKDVAKINTASNKKLSQADIGAYAANLYNKIMAKGDAAEIAIIKKIIAQNSKANALGSAAILCMMQGHPQAAMALSMKAVQSDPSNANWQNNMASLLTQYGYPETAIPVLRKLQNQLPANSTVLNNLAFAWLGLGETDSAKIFAGYAIRANSSHPDATLCGGLLKELNGDPVKATDDYIKAMENSVNLFTETLIKNNNGQDKLAKIDFEKLKRSITIYEYFPKDWIKIPTLSDNVSGYENDMRIKNGYTKMLEKLDAKVEEFGKASGAEIEKLFEKGETEFVKGMMKESIKGLSVMSKPAVIVQNILQAYLHNWTLDFQEEGRVLMININTQEKVMKKSGKNDKCPDFDRKNNEFLAYANPLVREFHAKKIEDFRIWLNAFCTWSWYIAGNPKNTILSACIAWTGFFTEMYSNAVESQYAEARSCVKQNSDGVTNIPVPDIPNFTCPAVVSIPVGTDWQQLSNEAKNFDNNSSGTRQNANNPVPNTSIAFGIGNMIAQPGKAPFIKTANGSISPGMINSADDELTPLSKIPLDELTPLPKLPKDDDLTPLPKIPLDDLTPLPDLRKNKLAKELLKKMMTTDCNKVKNSKDILKAELERMMKGVKELDAYENVIEQIKKLEAEIEQKEVDGQKKEQLKKQMEKMQQETDKMDKYEQMQQSKKEIEKIIKEMDAMDDKKTYKDKQAKIQQLVNEMEGTFSVLQDMKQNGLQPSISSGLQAPGTLPPMKGLFQ